MGYFILKSYFFYLHFSLLCSTILSYFPKKKYTLRNISPSKCIFFMECDEMTLTNEDLSAIAQLMDTKLSELDAKFDVKLEKNIQPLRQDIRSLKEEVSELRQDVSVLKKEVTILKEDVSALKQDVSALKQDVSALKQDVSVLKQDVSVLKQDVSVLKQDVSALKQDVSVLKQDVSVLKLKVATLEKDISALKQDVSVLKHKVSALEKEVDNLKQGLSHISLHLENVTDKQLQILAENYLPAAKRFTEAVSQIEELQNDNKIIKQVLAKHSEILQGFA
ncbi:hypothetical protein D7Y41_28865 [Anaerotruncus sp. 1XD22-93]|nr:hypothetical protein [Lachnospiraceae bacterium]NBI76635.1 hypothetical protein [Lachnospiraceae bacterium]RKJ78833.1 hypothetical protein D7Y41_28865 [Anaerotruncus sp. 1XD22-93]